MHIIGGTATDYSLLSSCCDVPGGCSGASRPTNSTVAKQTPSKQTIRAWSMPTIQTETTALLDIDDFYILFLFCK